MLRMSVGRFLDAISIKAARTGSGTFLTLAIYVDMMHIQYQGETLPPGISVSPGIR